MPCQRFLNDRLTRTCCVVIGCIANAVPFFFFFANFLDHIMLVDRCVCVCVNGFFKFFFFWFEAKVIHASDLSGQ